MTAQELLRHTRFVRAMARGVLGGDDRVEDAVQDTWVAALEGGPRETSRWRSWLGSVAKRRALDVRRREGTRRRHEGSARERRGVQTHPATADLVAEAEVGRRMVERVLALDDPYREAVLLRYVEDLPPREIAARLGLPVETVRTRVRRGLDRVRDGLDREHAGDRRAWVGALAPWALGGAAAHAGVGPLAAALVLLLAAVGVWALAERPWASRDGGDAPLAVGPEDPAGGRPADGGPGTDDGVRLAGLPGPQAEPEGDAVPDRAGDRHVVTGRVTDTSGAPVLGIPVRYSLKAPREEGAPWRQEDWRLSEAYTDADGRYVIDGLADGALWLSLLSERGFGPAEEVDHDLDGDWTHDFVVHGALTYAGRVVAPTAAPVRIQLDFREEMAGGGWGNIWGVREARLGADGRFVFTALRPGVYGLTVEAEGFARHTQRLELLRSRGDEEIVLAAGHPLRGRVVLPDGADVGATRLWIYADVGEAHASNIAVHEDGTFVVGDLPGGGYRIQVSTTVPEEDGRRLVRFWREARTVVAPGAAPVEIVLAPDEEVGLRVFPPEGAGGTRGVLRLPDAAGPVRQLAFRVRRREGGEFETVAAEISHAWPPVRERTADGLLRVPGLPRGRHRVLVEVPGYAAWEREIDVTGPMTLDVVLGRLAGRVVAVDFPGTYYRVEVRPSDAPGAEWSTLLWKDGRVRISHTPTPGIFRAHLPPGRYAFRVHSREYAETHLGPVEIEDGPGVRTLTFQPVAGATLQGRVVASAAGGDGRLLLHVFREQGDPGFERLEEKETAVADGRYRIEGLDAGRYRLSGSVTGEPVLVEVEVGAAGEVVRDLVLPGTPDAPLPSDPGTEDRPRPPPPAPLPPGR